MKSKPHIPNNTSRCDVSWAGQFHPICSAARGICNLILNELYQQIVKLKSYHCPSQEIDSAPKTCTCFWLNAVLLWMLVPHRLGLNHWVLLRIDCWQIGELCSQMRPACWFEIKFRLLTNYWCYPILPRNGSAPDLAAPPLYYLNSGSKIFRGGPNEWGGVGVQGLWRSGPCRGGGQTAPPLCKVNSLTAPLTICNAH